MSSPTRRDLQQFKHEVIKPNYNVVVQIWTTGIVLVNVHVVLLTPVNNNQKMVQEEPDVSSSTAL